MWRRGASRRVLRSAATAVIVAATAALLGGAGAAQSRGGAAGAAGGQLPDLTEASIDDLQGLMQSGRSTAREIAAAHLARIAAYDKAGPALNAMIALNPRALDEAEALDRERREGGPRGPLHGIPVVIKDNYETRDLPTTGGSLALAGFKTGRDAFQVKKLRDAGVVILGKTNLHELAAGIITISSLGGQTRNPYDPARTPGGSSGGTGGGRRRRASRWPAWRSDTCGSIRIPAANNNLFGLRGTRRAVEPDRHHPALAHAGHRRAAGPHGHRPGADARRHHRRGRRRRGDQCVRRPFHRHLPRRAWPPTRSRAAGSAFSRPSSAAAPEDDEVAAIVRKALDAVKAQGAELVEIQVPGLEDIVNQSSLIDLEFKTDLQRYLGQFPDAPVKSLQDILDRGLYHAALENTFKLRNAAVADPEEIRKVGTRRDLATSLMRAVFDEHRLDAVAYPTLRRRPVVVEEPQRGSNCQLSPTTGLPAMAMPAGFTTDGVPIGFELLGPAWSDQRLVAMAYAYEQAVKPRRRAPTTPALVDGQPPPPIKWNAGTVGTDRDPLAFAATFDPVSGRLTLDFPAAAVTASIHRGAPGLDGPVLHRLIDPASPARQVAVTLPPYQRPWLLDGTLRLSIGTGDGRITPFPCTWAEVGRRCRSAPAAR